MLCSSHVLITGYGALPVDKFTISVSLDDLVVVT
jgi:hypothetical protein